MSVAFIGLGLNDERGMTLEGLEEARNANTVFAEFYTNKMPGLDKKNLEDLVGKNIVVLDRVQLEDEGGKVILDAARKGKTALLVPGDPMIATTHVSIRLALARNGVQSRIVNAPSIISAICGATGLQSYKFGKSVTLPQESSVPRSVLDTISENEIRGLHTLMLLDVRSDASKPISVDQAAKKLVATNNGLKKSLAIGAARIGAKDEIVKAARLGSLQNENFGRIPHSMVFPGKLHFMEAEALKVFCGASDSDLGDSE